MLITKRFHPQCFGTDKNIKITIIIIILIESMPNNIGYLTSKKFSLNNLVLVNFESELLHEETKPGNVRI